MKTHVYEIEDCDAFKALFDSETGFDVDEMTANHGKLIWKGDMAIHPDTGDALVLDGAGKRQEYVIATRSYYYPDEGEGVATLIVHAHHAHGQELLS